MRFLLFPGQGSQKPGMGKDFYEQSAVAKQVLDEAVGALHAGFLDTLFNGDTEAVGNTRFAQPALLSVEVAIARHLESLGLQPSGCAGHSLGEITALVVAGVVSFSDALVFVQERARLMSEDVPPGGMAAVMGMEPEAIAAALPPGAQVANYNSPAQTIISGSTEALEAAAAALKAAGAKRVMPLNVSGPFHSEFMRPAADAFAKVLAGVNFSAPRCAFVSSVSGQAESDPSRIRDLLAQQLYSPVRWIQVMGAIGTPCLEVGPGGVLAGLAKRIDGAPEVSAMATMEDVVAL